MFTKYFRGKIEEQGRAYNIVNLNSLARDPQLLQETVEAISRSGLPIENEVSTYDLPLNLSAVRRARKSSVPLFHYNGRVCSHLTKTVADKLRSLHINPIALPSVKRALV